MTAISAEASGYYKQISDAWSGRGREVLTDAECIEIVRRLYREFMGTPWKGKYMITSGNRHTWPRRGFYYVNPNEDGKGISEIVHSMSHYVHYHKSKERPHSATHAALELRMVRFVWSSGAMDGRFKRESKPEPTRDDLIKANLSRIEAGIKRWQTKAKRAETALKKLAKQRRYYERKIAA